MKVILIDDEQLALDLLERHLNKIGDFTIVGKYTNPLIGLECIIEDDVDIVFLDINMPEVNGLEVAEKIQNEKPNIPIVFITAYDEYAVTAFELNALDYLIKPIRIDRLQKTVDRIRNTLHISARKRPHVQLYINICGQLLIGETKEVLQSISWRTAKAKELFLYLLHHENQLINKSLLAELLWPDLDPDKSFSQLYTTVYHVRNKLRDFNGHFKIESSMEGYILYTEDIFIDLFEWEKQIRSLPPVTAKLIEQYEEIMELNDASYLGEYDYLWAEATRYKYENLWLKFALKMGNYYFTTEYFEAAIIWYRKICERHPTIEDAHLALMEIYDILDEPILVKQQMQNLKSILREDLDTLPSSKVIEWYGRWKKQNRQLN